MQFKKQKVGTTKTRHTAHMDWAPMTKFAATLASGEEFTVPVLPGQIAKRISSTLNATCARVFGAGKFSVLRALDDKNIVIRRK